MNDTNEENQTPIGILLVFTFWVLIATYVFYYISRIDNSIMLILVLLFGTLLIFMGWGLISFQKWAFIFSIVFGFGGLLFSIVLFPYALVSLFSEVNSTAVIIVINPASNNKWTTSDTLRKCSGLLLPGLS